MNQTNSIDLILCELVKAQRKFSVFPIDPIHAAAIVVEEAGELQQAALEFTYEQGSMSAMAIEAAQVGAMAIRFLMQMEKYKKLPSEQI